MARSSGELPARVNRLRQRIEEWRRRGEPGAMPRELWDAAVCLARVHGICPISRALRIDYGGLKRRMMGTRPGAIRRNGSPRFVELGGGHWLGDPPFRSAAGPASTTVELWAGDGSRLVIRLLEPDGAEVLTLAASLWKNR
jgi:hypothetical protein